MGIELETLTSHNKLKLGGKRNISDIDATRG